MFFRQLPKKSIIQHSHFFGVRPDYSVVNFPACHSIAQQGMAVISILFEVGLVHVARNVGSDTEKVACLMR